MIKSLKNIFKSKISDNVNNISCNVELVPSYKFNLKYQDDIIGILGYDRGVWSFSYSEWFKNQNELQPLFEFPDTSRTYKNDKLWPFFDSRIPSAKQKKVKEYFATHPEDKNNLVKLLSVFGNSSVNNPYKLINV
jgi:HipA-like protein